MTPPVELVGLAAALLTTLCWLPQVVRTIRTRDTRAISLSTQAIFLAGNTLWLVYGILIGSMPVIGANLVTVLFVAVITGMKLRYG